MSKLSDALRGAKTRTDAEQIIAEHNPTKTDLRDAAADLGVTTGKSDSKDRIARGVAGAIGFRSAQDTVSGRSK